MSLARAAAARPSLLAEIPADRLGFAANALGLWALIGALAAVALLLLRPAGLALSADGLLAINPLVVLALAPAAGLYTFARFDERLASATNGFAVLIAGTPVLCLLTYAAAGLGRGVPLADAALARFDAALGFDWRAMMVWADAHPLAAIVGQCAYVSLVYQAALMVLALTLAGRAERLQAALYAFVIAACLCALGSALLPAVGPYTHYGLDPSQHPHIALVSRDLHLAEVLALREGHPRAFSLATSQGIVTCPSLHTALGILFTWAFWPLRWLRWPALAVNAALVAATPLHGSHYLADVVAGTAVIALALPAAGALHRAVAARAPRLFRPV